MKLFSMEEVELEFRDEALDEIAESALERKTGARGLRSIIENSLLDIMFDLPSTEGVDKVVVDAGVIKSENDPILIYQKKSNKKKTADK